jgi:hypothetical protein
MGKFKYKIAVQARLTTLSARQKSGDKKTTHKNREYSEKPYE